MQGWWWRVNPVDANNVGPEAKPLLPFGRQTKQMAASFIAKRKVMRSNGNGPCCRWFRQTQVVNVKRLQITHNQSTTQTHMNTTSIMQRWSNPHAFSGARRELHANEEKRYVETLKDNDYALMLVTSESLFTKFDALFVELPVRVERNIDSLVAGVLVEDTSLGQRCQARSRWVRGDHGIGLMTDAGTGQRRGSVRKNKNMC